MLTVPSLSSWNEHDSGTQGAEDVEGTVVEAMAVEGKGVVASTVEVVAAVAASDVDVAVESYLFGEFEVVDESTQEDEGSCVNEMSSMYTVSGDPV